MDCPRVQSTVHVRVGAADTGVTVERATKKAATMAANRDAILIIVSPDHKVTDSARGACGLDTET